MDWRLGEHNRRPAVHYRVRHPSGRPTRTSGRWVIDGDLTAALRQVIADVEGFFDDPQFRRP